MKKSDITVSMPLTAFEELRDEKAQYEALKNEIRGCFNCEENIVQFDTIKALGICKRYLSQKYQNANFERI